MAFRMINYEKRNKAILFILCPILGILSNLVIMLITYGKEYRFGIYPLASAFSDDNALKAMFLLLMCGVIESLLSTVKAWKLGIATISLMPFIAIFEGIINPELHHLLPFEILLTYPYMAFFVIIGATFTRIIVNKLILSKRRNR
jgi:hypothetical protein